ncbi:MAG: Na+/H+ antiporter NhaC family protein, partial [Plesiomonas shigelloides]
LSFMALCLGALLDELGYLRVAMQGLLQQVKRLGSLVALVIGACFVTNGLMGEVYLSIIVNGNLFRQEFAQRGLQPAMLSRTLEEGATLTGPLIPWTTAGAFMGGVLGVSAFDYAPYTFLNLINPLLAIVFAFGGLAVLRAPAKPIPSEPTKSKLHSAE